MKDRSRRVAITGIGIVSAAGNDLGKFWDAISEGRTAISEIENVPTDRLSTKVAAEVKDFDGGAEIGRKANAMDRFAQFAVVAARDAIKDSGYSLETADVEQIPVIIGTGVGGLNTLDDAFLEFYGRDAARLHPLTIPRLMINAAASHVSMDLGLRGETYAISSACASGAHAIGQAARAILSGSADIAVTGGTEACLTVGTIKAWEALRVMSPDGCRPFCQTRSGMILGEGAAILVLEDARHAVERGAEIYAYMEGYGASADAGDLTSPDVQGARRAIDSALRDAQFEASEVDYVNAHGTGTTLNDVTETAAIRLAFGDHADRLQVSSSKAILGHTLGAAGALEAAVIALAMQQNTVPPTAGWTSRDPECDLDYVPNTARSATIRKAISNSFAFGGLNCCLAFSNS
ncbi:MAG: beta-ketoacyl-[acyl-carrier-protein] synthase family protein [Erythrobacter sp.]|nr:beta-ketoacyl-[acyl-carrier-protein] synthase family protein [Erythrobacter sp.]